MRVVGIDPGPRKSAIAVFDGRLLTAWTCENFMMIDHIRRDEQILKSDTMVCEQVIYYSNTPSGRDVYDTAYWSGFFQGLWMSASESPTKVDLLSRPDILEHLCNNRRAKKKHVRQALIDRFGKPPTKKCPNPNYPNGTRPSYHEWDAWACAVTCYDKGIMIIRGGCNE